MVIFWIVLVFLVLCSAFFSASETSLFSLSSFKVKMFQHSSSMREKAIFRLLSRPGELLITILIMNVAVNLGVQNVASNLFEHRESFVFSVLFPFFLTLIVGEAIPKSIAISKNLFIARLVSPFILAIRWLIFPLRKIAEVLATFFSKFFVIFFHKEKEISRKELMHTLHSSVQKGLIDPEEVEIFENVLGIGEVSIKEIMRPRQDILHFSLDRSIEELQEIFVDKECSRVVVIGHEIDEVLGILSWENFFHHQAKIHCAKDVVRYCQAPVFIPETMKAFDLLVKIKEKGRQLYLVVDEYGLISGLITKEDLIEEVIGQIHDKRDEMPLYHFQSKNVVIADGKMEISDLEEEFHVELDNPTFKATIGGWLTEQFKDIPKSGMKLEKNGLLFHILSAGEKNVNKVFIKKLSKKM